MKDTTLAMAIAADREKRVQEMQELTDTIQNDVRVILHGEPIPVTTTIEPARRSPLHPNHVKLLGDAGVFDVPPERSPSHQAIIDMCDPAKNPFAALRDGASDPNRSAHCAPRPRTLAQLAQEAIDIQNTCNIRGISKSFAKIVDEVYDLIAADVKANPISLTRYENVQHHPVVKMWASKIHDLCHMGLSDSDAYHDAYEACRKMAKRER